jgi:hypothetical protein
MIQGSKIWYHFGSALYVRKSQWIQVQNCGGGEGKQHLSKRVNIDFAGSCIPHYCNISLMRNTVRK